MTDYATLADIEDWATSLMASRSFDQQIDNGDPNNPYLQRWFITPRAAHANNYLHWIMRSDDDRALHDHPWDNVSYVIQGGYWEHSPGGVVIWRGPGSVVRREASALHRLELATDDLGLPIPCLSLFSTGPKVREWGFACPDGWRHWREFDTKGCE